MEVTPASPGHVPMTRETAARIAGTVLAGVQAGIKFQRHHDVLFQSALILMALVAAPDYREKPRLEAILRMAGGVFALLKGDETREASAARVLLCGIGDFAVAALMRLDTPGRAN